MILVSQGSEENPAASLGVGLAEVAGDEVKPIEADETEIAQDNATVKDPVSEGAGDKEVAEATPLAEDPTTANPGAADHETALKLPLNNNISANDQLSAADAEQARRIELNPYKDSVKDTGRETKDDNKTAVQFQTNGNSSVAGSRNQESAGSKFKNKTREDIFNDIEEINDKVSNVLEVV